MHEVEQQLTALHQRMRQLKEETRAIRGSVFALETYFRHGRGATLLRWRYLVGRHAIWERDIEPSLGSFPAGLQAWYRRTNVASVILNVQERCLRYERSALRRLLEWLRASEEWQSTIHRMPAPETLALLSCNYCGAPFDETASEGQSPNPGQRI